jgi:hypothetical protein
VEETVSTEAAAYTVLALVLGVSVAWCHGWWARGRHDTARRTAVLAERATRPPDQRAGLEDGAEHEPNTCTRKDQTT